MQRIQLRQRTSNDNNRNVANSGVTPNPATPTPPHKNTSNVNAIANYHHSHCPASSSYLMCFLPSLSHRVHRFLEYRVDYWVIGGVSTPYIFSSPTNIFFNSITYYAARPDMVCCLCGVTSCADTICTPSLH